MMEKLGLWMEIYQQRDEWRCASTIPGVLCVMTSGTTVMPVWSADSWDCPVLVSTVVELFTCNSTFPNLCMLPNFLIFQLNTLVVISPEVKTV